MPHTARELVLTWFGLQRTGEVRPRPTSVWSMIELTDGCVFVEQDTIQLMDDAFRDAVFEAVGWYRSPL